MNQDYLKNLYLLEIKPSDCIDQLAGFVVTHEHLIYVLQVLCSCIYVYTQNVTDKVA